MLQNLIGKKLKTFKLKSRTMGQGVTGVVVEGVDLRNNQPVAVKIMYFNASTYQEVKKKAVTEISILTMIHNNDNVVKYVDSFETDQLIFIVTDLCNGGDLHEYLLSHEPEEEEAVVMLKHILNGFKGLHEAGIMHRDLKTANILLHDGICKIADFGLSKNVGVGNMARSSVGTPLTNAPEIIEGKEYGFEADIWSIGVVFYRILYGFYPYQKSTAQQILDEMKNSQVRFQVKGKKISQESIDFIKRCLTVDPKKRIKWRQIYRHPLITERPESEALSSSYIQMGMTTTIIDKDLSQIQNFYEKTELVEAKEDPKALEELGKSMQRIEYSDESRNAERQKQKAREQIIGRFEQLYLGKKQDIMFFVHFIHPLINNVRHVRANHDVAGFVLGKKCYSELGKLHNSMKDKKIVFHNQPNFQQFLSYPQYDEIEYIVWGEMQKVQTILAEYRKNIKMTTLEIESEFNDKAIKNSNYDGLMRVTVKEYLRLLYERVEGTKGEAKKTLISLIMALEYYGDTTRVHAQEFERILARADFGMHESRIIRRI